MHLKGKSLIGNKYSKNKINKSIIRFNPKSYNFKITKLKALRKINHSVEGLKVKNEINEYGYKLPKIESNRFKVSKNNRNSSLIQTTPTSHLTRNFINHHIGIKSINTSYVKEEYKNIIKKFGVSSQVGYNPRHLMKLNQDSFVVTDMRK